MNFPDIPGVSIDPVSREEFEKYEQELEDQERKLDEAAYNNWEAYLTKI